MAALAAVLKRVQEQLSAEDHRLLVDTVGTLVVLTRELETKGTSIQRLRKMIFGASTEKTRHLFDDEPPDPVAPVPADSADPHPGAEDARPGDAAQERAQAPGDGAPEASPSPSPPRRRPPGHGRNGATSYRGADKVPVPHASLHAGNGCPGCEGGRLYPLGEPSILIRVTGMAPLSATLYELERLRCAGCGGVFTASPPDGVGPKKYDETAAAMIGMLKYGSGLPFHRLEKLQGSIGIPLPRATQWEVVAEAADTLELAYDELVTQAAQAAVLYNDDTTMKILNLDTPLPWEKGMPVSPPNGVKGQDRTGVFTSGIIAETADGGPKIALFYTGRKHAGENIAAVLAERRDALAAPIQMSDALSRNSVPTVNTVHAYCTTHARRNFVDVATSFPKPVRHVLEQLRQVYHNDAVARTEALSAEQRLHYHQKHSGPVMAELKTWLDAQQSGHDIEPNSGLGSAIAYMVKHWDALTLFLRTAGAPIDNNICERALKRAILHRKNALFYKTRNGARVGDIFMTLIHTTELNGVTVFDYLVALLRHPQELSDRPEDWMPWNYKHTLARLAEVPSPDR